MKLHPLNLFLDSVGHDNKLIFWLILIFLVQCNCNSVFYYFPIHFLFELAIQLKLRLPANCWYPQTWFVYHIRRFDVVSLYHPNVCIYTQNTNGCVIQTIILLAILFIKYNIYKLPTLLSIFSYFPNERRLPVHVLASPFSKPFSAGCLLACESCSWNWPITGRHRICDTILNAYKLHMNYYE